MSDITDLIGLGADWLSLVLVVASFLVIAFLAYRAKTIRSFQFEIFVVLLVIVLSEVPKILSELTMIDVSTLETTGLIVHTIVMAFLSLFIALRAARYLK